MRQEKIRAAIIGCGFWSRFQALSWKEHEGVELVGLYNRTREKAEKLSHLLGGVPVYDTPEEMIKEARPHVVDIITSEESHKFYTELAASLGVHVITQKPMASSWRDCLDMTGICQKAGVNLYVHDNWRWQAPIAAYRQALETNKIGPLHRARISYMNSFPVFDNQPFLKETEHFIIMDMGTHLFDTARSLYGEARSLTCLINRVNPAIKGEDVATILLEMERGMHLTIEMSYSSPVENDDFPYTRIHTEGKSGSLELAPNLWIRETSTGGWKNNETRSFQVSPPRRSWTDPEYVLSTASCEPAIGDILADLQGVRASGLRGESYLNSMLWVFAAYESAARGQTINIQEYRREIS
jgi:predicted dehydrogenase